MEVHTPGLSLFLSWGSFLFVLVCGFAGRSRHDPQNRSEQEQAEDEHGYCLESLLDCHGVCFKGRVSCFKGRVSRCRPWWVEAVTELAEVFG